MTSLPDAIEEERVIPVARGLDSETTGRGRLPGLTTSRPEVDRVIPTGGIDAGNALAYLEAGAVAVGIGGWLTGVGDPSEITRRALLLREAVSGSTVT